METEQGREDLEKALLDGVTGWLGEEGVLAAAISFLTTAAKAALVLAGPAAAAGPSRKATYQNLEEDVLTDASNFAGLLFSGISSLMLLATPPAPDASFSE